MLASLANISEVISNLLGHPVIGEIGIEAKNMILNSCKEIQINELFFLTDMVVIWSSLIIIFWESSQSMAKGNNNYASISLSVKLEPN